MARPAILHMISPQKHVSPFDVNMAADAGFEVIATYGEVGPKDVAGLVQDMIFSRAPKDARRTALFIGGRDAGLALDMLKAAKKAMMPPFAISVFADPSGSLYVPDGDQVIRKGLSPRQLVEQDFQLDRVRA